MRKSAYLKALEEASKLPESIQELARYFGDCYSPRLQAISYIKKLARLDVEGLFDGEAEQILSWGPGKRA